MSFKNYTNKNNDQLYIGKIPYIKNHKEQKEVYEVIRIENGIPLFIEEHLLRLENSFKRLELSKHYHNNTITNAISQLIREKQIDHINIKISCFIDAEERCQYYIFPISSSYPSQELYANGIDTVLLEAERNNPNIKIGNTKVRENANLEIKDKHVYEVLLVNHDGLITEGSRSNVFFILGDTIYTAPSNIILEGIIRSKTLEIIKKSSFKLSVESIHVNQLHDINSAFITGTSPRILPVKSINNVLMDVDNTILRQLMIDLNHTIFEYKKNAETK